ncbi:MAG TPA: vitamin K epoxide reductase family protein [Candidatus Saccharimonadales bacterium]|nr:vitamin K epoxide reductase family protein [Candidatus Saccharimonadales bacterium]
MRRPKITVQKALPYILIIGGIIGVICSFVITQDKFAILQDPHFKPSCDLNPIVSCGSVMQSHQSHIFGFSNTYIGLIGFPVLTTIGMAWLAGAKFKRWFWLGLGSGLTLGLSLAYWLLWQSVNRIHALCPYCLTVDVVMITSWWYTMLYLVDQKYLRVPKGKASTAYGWARKHHLDLLLLWFLILIALILHHFWYYYGQHLF